MSFLIWSIGGRLYDATESHSSLLFRTLLLAVNGFPNLVHGKRSRDPSEGINTPKTCSSRVQLPTDIVVEGAKIVHSCDAASSNYPPL